MTDIEIDFSAAATLRKWPSLKNERVTEAWGAATYLISEGTLDECIKQFMSKAAQHLYEIRTKPQPPLVTEVLQREHIVELARLRDFL